jgi:drug/metabolite transporter (DMT)-like permease
VWGFAFVAQRAGMEFLGPFTFNGLRFLLGSLFLIPFLFLVNRHSRSTNKAPDKYLSRYFLLKGFITGIILFCAASLQQIGIIYTTAGRAGFITGLYVIIVPFLGLLWGKPSKRGIWIGAIFAIIGLYLLSNWIEEKIIFGDLIVLVSAFFWALHVHVIDWLVEKSNALKLAFMQFCICALLSIIVALMIEDMSYGVFIEAIIPILYAGPVSVGIGYTLQVIAQTEAHPSHAAIILSLEAVFAAIGGWLILREILSLKEIVGCTLMLMGMFFSIIQLKEIGKKT